MKSSYFDSGYWFWHDSRDRTLYSELRGSRAKVVDVKMARNGVIYSIDSVLGIPNQNIAQKLEHGLFSRFVDIRHRNVSTKTQILFLL